MADRMVNFQEVVLARALTAVLREISSRQGSFLYSMEEPQCIAVWDRGSESPDNALAAAAAARRNISHAETMLRVAQRLQADLEEFWKACAVRG